MDKSKVIKSLIYKFTERFAVKGLGLAISIVLARLMAPEAFGQIAILTVVINLSLIFIEGGLSSALVQSSEVDDRDFSTVFYISLLLSALLIAILHLAAPIVARFYNSPELTEPLKAYSFALLPRAFNAIQTAHIQREMRFKEMMVCNLAACIGSGVIGIWLALKGLGLWALVVYYVAQIIISGAAMFMYVRWLPRSRFSMDSARRLYKYGIRILGASLITTLYADIRPLIIGKKFSTTQLGYYDRGMRFSTTISINLDLALQSVMFPVLSRSQNEPEQFRGILRKTRSLGALITFPLLMGMAAVAEPMVRLLLTEEWLPCVIFIQLLCVAEAQLPLTSANLVAIKATGRSDILLKLSILRISLMLGILIVSVVAFDSVVAITVGYLISAWLDTCITSLVIQQMLGYKITQQFADIWKSGAAAVLMAIAVIGFGMLSMPLIIKFCLQIITGVIVFVLINLLLKNESLMYMLNAVKSMLRK